MIMLIIPLPPIRFICLRKDKLFMTKRFIQRYIIRLRKVLAIVPGLDDMKR